MYLFPKSDHTTLAHFAVLHKWNSLRIFSLAGASLDIYDRTDQPLSVAGPHELRGHDYSRLEIFDSPQPLPQYDRIALPVPNFAYPSGIAIIEDRLSDLWLNPVDPFRESFTLLSPAEVVVRVDRTGLRAESRRQAGAISESSQQGCILFSTISQNGRFLACGYERGLLEVYDLDSGSRTPVTHFLGLECYNPVFLAFVLEDTHIAVWGERPQEESHANKINHRNLAVQLVKLSKYSQPPTKVGKVRRKTHSQEQKGHPPVISSGLSMSIELEWTGDSTPQPMLTRFDPDFSYQQALSFQSVDSSADYLRAFSPNNRYVGISALETSWVWSTSTGDPVYTVKGGFLGINHVPATLRLLISSPFPDPSQVTYYATDTFRYSTNALLTPSSPPNGDAGSAATNWDSAVFVMLHELDEALHPDEYHRARTSWRSNGFMPANATTGNIRLDNGRLCFAHPSFHSSFYSDSLQSASEDTPSSPHAWVQKGGSRILLGGRNGVPHVVLDVGV